MSRVRVSRLRALAATPVRVRLSRLTATTLGASGTNRVRVGRLQATTTSTGPVANAGQDVTSDALMLVTLSSAGSSGAPAVITWSVDSVTVGTVAAVDAAQLGATAYVRTPAHWANQVITMKLVVSTGGVSSVDTVRITVIAHDRFYSTVGGLMKPLARREAAAFPAGVTLI